MQLGLGLGYRLFTNVLNSALNARSSIHVVRGVDFLAILTNAAE